MAEDTSFDAKSKVLSSLFDRLGRTDLLELLRERDQRTVHFLTAALTAQGLLSKSASAGVFENVFYRLAVEELRVSFLSMPTQRPRRSAASRPPPSMRWPVTGGRISASSPRWLKN